MPSEKQQSKNPLMSAHYSEVSTSETSDDVDVVWNIDLRCKRHSLARYQWLTPYLLHGLLLIVYACLFGVAYRYKKGLPVVDELGIPYVQQVFEVNPALNESIARLYTGPPSDELDEAWEKLLQYGNIRISEEEMRGFGRLDEGVRFTDGSGYFAQMTMYHHLHCIMRVHHFLHVEHYWPNATEEDMYLLRAHNYHCLDTLRQAILCQGDTSLITFRFGPSQPIPLANFTTPHTCKSWPAIESYNQERFVDVFQPGLVVHPKFGPSYAGEGSDIGVVVEEDPDHEEKEKGIIKARDGLVGSMGRNINERHHKGVDDVIIDEGTDVGNGLQKRQSVKMAGWTEAGNGRQKRQKFDVKLMNKHIDKGRVDDGAIREEKMRAAWSRRSEDEKEDEGRKGKAAVANLRWKRKEQWR